MDGNWIKLHRKLLDSDVFGDAELLRVWLWCLLRANWKQSTYRARTGRGDTDVLVGPGQFIYGRNAAGQALGMDGKRVDRYMVRLEKRRMVGRQKFHHYSIITVLNWNLYQSDGQPTGRRRATNGQATGTYKKHKKGENTKKRVDHKCIGGMQGGDGKYIPDDYRKVVAAVKPKNDADESFCRRVCTLKASGACSEDDFWDAVEGVRQCNPKNPIGYVRKLLRDRVEDFEAKLREVPA